jgi:hypothetical protein
MISPEKKRQVKEIAGSEWITWSDKSHANCRSAINWGPQLKPYRIENVV